MAHTETVAGGRVPTLTQLSNDAILLRTDVIAARVTGSPDIYDRVIEFIDQLQAALHSPDRCGTQNADLDTALAAGTTDC